MNEPEIKEIYQNYPLSLLLEADPDIKKIEKYLNKGRCFAVFDGPRTIGVYVLKDLKNKTAEKNFPLFGVNRITGNAPKKSLNPIKEQVRRNTPR